MAIIKVGYMKILQTKTTVSGQGNQDNYKQGEGWIPIHHFEWKVRNDVNMQDIKAERNPQNEALIVRMQIGNATADLFQVSTEQQGIGSASFVFTKMAEGGSGGKETSFFEIDLKKALATHFTFHTLRFEEKGVWKTELLAEVGLGFTSIEVRHSMKGDGFKNNKAAFDFNKP